MLKLRAITPDGLDVASDLLTKGFPSRTKSFWQNGLRRLSEYGAERTGSIGNFLMAGDTPVGVLLTICKDDSETGQRIVNLSSWYVEESHRWYAPRMLMAATSDSAITYTDLTPSMAATELNLRLGFRTISYDLMLFLLPWTAIVGHRRARQVPLDMVPANAVQPSLLEDMHRHQALGCIVAAMKDGDTYGFVVFDTILKKRLRIARVIYASSLDLVQANTAALAMLLLRHGVPLLSLQVPVGQVGTQAWRWKKNLRYQVKGPWDDQTINELYSERVLLNV